VPVQKNGGGLGVSIRSRIEDALFLWNAGRLEGAFVSVLIATAATAKRTFPKKGDRQAFEDFLHQGWFERISVEYRGEIHPMYHIFYKWVRCELVHEGSLPMDVDFMPDPGPGILSVRAGGAPEFVLKVSHGWFRELFSVVINAEVNIDLVGTEWNSLSF
jgi:hypothetical protein